MVTSTDGGTLWSSEATLAISPTALAGAPARAGRTRRRPREPKRRAAQRARVGVALADPASARWSTLVDLRRTRAKRTARVRLVPRRGHARTLRLAVRGCGRIA
jgi:hypothetical protein